MVETQCHLLRQVGSIGNRHGSGHSLFSLRYFHFFCVCAYRETLLLNPVRNEEACWMRGETSSRNGKHVQFPTIQNYNDLDDWGCSSIWFSLALNFTSLNANSCKVVGEKKKEIHKVTATFPSPRCTAFSICASSYCVSAAAKISSCRSMNRRRFIQLHLFISNLVKVIVLLGKHRHTHMVFTLLRE